MCVLECVCVCWSVLECAGVYWSVYVVLLLFSRVGYRTEMNCSVLSLSGSYGLELVLGLGQGLGVPAITDFFLGSGPKKSHMEKRENTASCLLPVCFLFPSFSPM